MNFPTNPTPSTLINRSFTVLALFVATLLLCAGSQGCAASRPAEFATPDAAAASFVAAVRTHDSAEMKRILGSEAQEILSSGDDVADQQMRDRFIKAYDEMNQLIRSSDNEIVVLNVGANDWPLPMPIVKDNKTGKWYFDAEAGAEEIANRRIGRNELDVIEVCRAIVDAQAEFTFMDPDGDGIAEYARKIISDPGKRNGLYWEVAPGAPPSPLGPLVASAVEEGYGKDRSQSDAPRPYHGYYYRLLTSQGANAPGGAMDYIVNGRMIGGFALVAYPAQYGSSGIMTFIVSHRGKVYQKDLGDDTEKTAKAMTAFDPGDGWTEVTAPTDSAASSDKG